MGEQLTAGRWLIALQVAAVLVLGTVAVAASPIWGASDERAHASYVQVIVDEHRLPVLGRDCIAPDLAALGRPGAQAPPGSDCRRQFLAASYEAFQPPLAYLAYAPLYAGTSGKARVYALRVETLLLFVVSVLLVLWLLRRESFEQSTPIAAVTLTFFLLPVVLVRNANVTNGALEMVLATAFLGATWNAYRTGNRRMLLFAGALLGLTLLTKLTAAYLAGVYVLAAAGLFHRSRRAGDLVAGAAGALCALALVAPWLAFNHSHYGSWTANELAQEIQRPYVDPGGYRYAARDLPALNLSLVNPLPEEWGPGIRPDASGHIPYNTPARLALGGLAAVVLVALLIVGLRARRRYWWFVAPAALDLALLNVTLLKDQWNIFVPRYLFTAGPAVAAALGVALVAIIGERRTLQVAGCASTLLVALFIWKAHAYYR